MKIVKQHKTASQHKLQARTSHQEKSPTKFSGQQKGEIKSSPLNHTDISKDVILAKDAKDLQRETWVSLMTDFPSVMDSRI